MRAKAAEIAALRLNLPREFFAKALPHRVDMGLPEQ